MSPPRETMTLVRLQPRYRKRPSSVRRILRPRRRRRTPPYGLIAFALLLVWAAVIVISQPRFGAEGRDDQLRGEPTHIVDGDTFDLSGRRLRLAGIDAPEMDTVAGASAREALVSLIANAPIVCRDTGERSYGRVVATCRDAQGVDVAETIVRAGWATDIPRFSGGRYQLSEWRARRERLGMFAR